MLGPVARDFAQVWQEGTKLRGQMYCPLQSVDIPLRRASPCYIPQQDEGCPQCTSCQSQGWCQLIMMINHNHNNSYNSYNNNSIVNNLVLYSVNPT